MKSMSCTYFGIHEAWTLFSALSGRVEAFGEDGTLRTEAAAARLVLMSLVLWFSVLPVRAQSDAWEADIQGFEAADEADPPLSEAVLFVGSSSIRMWTTLEEDFPDVPIINRGFGGSEITDIIRFADRIVVPYQPRMIFFYAGDNDIANDKSAADVVADFQRFVDLVHESLPSTRIAFISIKPSPARWEVLGEMRKANGLISEYAASTDLVEYVDVFTQMLDAAGRPRAELFAEDGLHLNENGYRLWREVSAPFLAPEPAR